MDVLDELLIDYGDCGAGDLMIDGILGAEEKSLESTEQISERSIRLFLKRQQKRNNM
jgi:hypothetical protein